MAMKNNNEFHSFGFIPSIALIILLVLVLLVSLVGCSTVKRVTHSEVLTTDSTAKDMAKKTATEKTNTKLIEVVKEKSTITVPGLDTASQQLLQAGIPNTITTPQGSFSAFVQDGKIELSVSIPPKTETTEREITREITGSSESITQEDDTRETRVAKARSIVEKAITKTPYMWWSNWWLWIILVVIVVAWLFRQKILW